jgi:hypothetical protein
MTVSIPLLRGGHNISNCHQKWSDGLEMKNGGGQDVTTAIFWPE